MKVGDLIQTEFDGVISIGIVIKMFDYEAWALWNDGEVEPIDAFVAEVISESR